MGMAEYYYKSRVEYNVRSLEHQHQLEQEKLNLEKMKEKKRKREWKPGG